MISYNTEFFKGEPQENLSKKRLSEMVHFRIVSSLSDLNIKGKKLENKIKKISRSLAKDIARLNKRQKKAGARVDNP